MQCTNIVFFVSMQNSVQVQTISTLAACADAESQIMSDTKIIVITTRHVPLE